jgi:hypothetical protein
MGLGIIVGSTHNVFDYLDPRGGNAYVIIFHITGIVLLALSVFWIYFAGGAEFLIKHPGTMNIDCQIPARFKTNIWSDVIGRRCWRNRDVGHASTRAELWLERGITNRWTRAAGAVLHHDWSGEA